MRHFKYNTLITTVIAMLMPASIPASAAPAQLDVISDPAGAKVIFDGEPRGTTPLTLSPLSAGKHLMTINKSGYQTYRETSVLSADEKATREVKLVPILGLVLVHSTPEGADIEVEGMHRGNTPALITDLPLGRYRATLSKPNYIPKTIELTINNRSPRKYAITLTSDSATLALNSEPAGATVLLNGVNRGETPCTIERVPSGETDIEITLDGFKPYTDTVKLSAGENQTVTATLRAIPSNLKIVSIPTGARIYVDNQFQGKAPVTLHHIAPGSYRVRAEMKAHDPLARTIEIGRARDLVEELRLLKNAGRIEITTEPAGVSVLIDGKTKGVTSTDTNRTDRVSEPFTIALVPSGVHVLKLTQAGYYETRIDLDIARDETHTGHYRLKRRFIPNFEVKTASEVYRGILIEVDARKNIKLETHPGIFKTIPRTEIKSATPLRQDKLDAAL